MANFLLQKFKTIEEFFIPVDPFEGKNQTANSLKGIKLTLQCLRDGHPVGIFPSGEVSTYYPNQEGIMDKEWQTSALKVIQKSGVPVIPVFFHGTNSKTFHMLGKIHPLLRTTWIVREFYNKRGKNIKISIRDAISPEEIKKFEDVRELGLFLRARTYGLA
jgi:putative hemolysin